MTSASEKITVTIRVIKKDDKEEKKDVNKH